MESSGSASPGCQQIAWLEGQGHPKPFLSGIDSPEPHLLKLHDNSSISWESIYFKKYKKISYCLFHFMIIPMVPNGMTNEHLKHNLDIVTILWPTVTYDSLTMTSYLKFSMLIAEFIYGNIIRRVGTTTRVTGKTFSQMQPR